MILFQSVGVPSAGSLKDLHFAHLKHDIFHKNKGKPPFTSRNVQVYARIPVRASQNPPKPVPQAPLTPSKNKTKKKSGSSQPPVSGADPS